MTHILYKATFDAPIPLRDRLINLLEEYCTSVSYGAPQTLQDRTVRVEGYWPSNQSTDDIATHIRQSLACHNLNTDLPFTIEIIPPTNWLAVNASQNFPPIIIEPFVVFTSPPTKPLSPENIPIHIQSMMGFGSGEHATTQGCLKGLSALRNHDPRTLLDMGCGSGVLAIAAAKLFHQPVVAVDVDPFSIQATQENALANKCVSEIKVRLGNGYSVLKKSETFDMVTCNILAGPVCSMAPSLTHHLNRGGYGIVSGLLTSQAKDVSVAHIAQGLVHTETYTIEGWSTLVFYKE